MAANRPNLGLQVALIIFVLITIALAVSTFMFFKQNQETLASQKEALGRAAKAAEDTEKAKADLKAIKDIVGKGDGDDVKTILAEWEADKKLYGATKLDAAQIYPQMLKNLQDAWQRNQVDITDLTEKAEKIRAEYEVKKKEADGRVAEYKASVDKTSAEALAELKKHDDDRGTYGAEKEALAKQIEDKRKQMVELEAKSKQQAQTLSVALTTTQDKLKTVETVVGTYTKEDFSAPDGKIVRVNQRDRSVWIDLGQLDNLRRQMTFSVYDKSVENIADKKLKPKPKGSIEVNRILDGHLAECTITDDKITDPIMPEDKIMSPTYRPGKPEHFAVVGLIDFDGDGRSDLNQLLTLISNNGGVVDAVVDDEGVRTGAITPDTKMLVLGERPTENVKSPEMLKSYSQLIKEADDAHISTMNLKDFIKFMGYQGRERSVPLSKSSSESVGPGSKPDTFRKRPGASE
ncbi:MAG: hypothetical protein K8T25_23910 [Planctomycetia bacterium]|nr:hypothetical protein [Planctomycetia bacterium]